MATYVGSRTRGVEHMRAGSMTTGSERGAYPITDRASLSDAIHAFGRAKDKAAVKAHIISKAKALGLTDMLPADWEGSTKKA